MIESTQDTPVDPEPEPLNRGYRRGVGCPLDGCCGEFDSHIPERRTI